MTNQICIHCYVSGRVQGVGYRASTQRQAEQFGLTGWVRNLPDGRVEVLACGHEDGVAKLYEWLKGGPRLANVTDVSYEKLPWKEYKGFETL